MPESTDFYVYIIYRPNGVPCYVGKGRGRRLDHHARFSHNRHLKNIYRQNGGTLPHQKIAFNLTEKEACDFEIATISALGRKDLGAGPLVNLSNGGEGLSGHIKSAETRAKLSKIHKGRIKSPQERANMSAALRGKRRSEESIQKQRETVTGKPKPWVSAALKGRPAPWVRDRLLGSKHPEHAQKMTGNKNSAGKNIGNKHASKLSPDDVLEIKRRLTSRESQRSIASHFGVGQSAICAINLGRSWA